jgi:hypothetical protein
VVGNKGMWWLSKLVGYTGEMWWLKRGCSSGSEAMWWLKKGCSGSEAVCFEFQCL